MILLFDMNPPLLWWCAADENGTAKNKCEFSTGWFNRVFEDIGDTHNITAIGYFMYHGGEEIQEPVGMLSADSLMKLEKSIKYLPEYNDILYKTALYWVTRLPMVPQILFCDTAFFLDLPPESATYALPYKLRKSGIRRYGGYGICHQWAWSQALVLNHKPTKRVVSIHLGNVTNCAAILDGIPIETSIGFTSVEGIPSPYSCGDIDPTIIFQLFSQGMSFDEINQVLSRDSGFSGFLGKPCSFLDLMQHGDESDIAPVRDIFSYSLQKYIGAMISVLGGVDALIFHSRYPDDTRAFIDSLIPSLGFLGISKPEHETIQQEPYRLTARDSDIQVFSLPYNKWEIMAEKARTLLAKQEV